jgi:hypothetical protein
VISEGKNKQIARCSKSFWILSEKNFVYRHSTKK